MPKQQMKDKKNAQLTDFQKSIVVASLLGDGWFEVSPNSKTARIGLELSTKTEDLLLAWNNWMMPFASPTITKFQRKATGSIQGGPMIRNRTFFHQEFLPFTNVFKHSFLKTAKGKPAKTVPPVSSLKQYINWQMFALLLCMDGSRKNQGRGMEIHLQGFSYEAQGRLCVALYQVLGIKCWPSKYVESSRKQTTNTDRYHITISGFSLQTIRKNALPHMVESCRYKVPILSERIVTNAGSSPWIQWYKAAKSANWLENEDI